MKPSEDALSEVLRMVRLRACIYFVKNMAPPWGLDVPTVANGPLHMVLEGNCVLRHDGCDYELEAGDAVVLPNGARHQMLDAPESIPESGLEALPRLMNGGNTEPVPGATRMLCGHFEWDGALDHPMFRELPELIIVRDVFARQSGEQFGRIVNLIVDEFTGPTPGGSAVADRMGEVLFVSILRAWMLEHQPATGVLATMNDARLSRALSFIHQYSDTQVDLDGLARVAGMSRTSFAVRFRDVMGTPPAAYLTECRLLQARRLLLHTELATPTIIDQVGYGSEAAFVRAFKRRFGETPARLRCQSAIQ